MDSCSGDKWAHTEGCAVIWSKCVKQTGQHVVCMDVLWLYKCISFFYLLLPLCVWAGGKTPLQNFLGIAEQHMGPNNGVSTHSIWTSSRETWTAIGAVTVIAVFRDISYLLVLALPRPQLDRLLFGWSGSVWIPTVESTVSTAEAPNRSQILIMFF